MGIDFNSLSGIFENLRKASAKISKGKNYNDDTIDAKNELFTYMTGVKGVKNQANAEGADFTEADVEKAAKAELQQYLDYDFGTKEVGIEDKNANGVFDEDEISLENLMTYLDENIDMDKVSKYNEKGIVAEDTELKAVDTLTDAGFDEEIVNILVNDDSIAGAVRYIVKDIISGKANDITKSVIEFNGFAFQDGEYHSEFLDTAGLLIQDADYQKSLT